jgi:Skp family chaperone for outer membrane proteins
MGMGTVEDVRKVLQDFLAPELRAVAARFDAIDQRFDSLSKVMDARFEAISNRFDAVDTKLASLEKEADTKFASLEKEIVRVRELLDVDRRLAKLESQHSQPTQ